VVDGGAAARFGADDATRVCLPELGVDGDGHGRQPDLLEHVRLLGRTLRDEVANIRANGLGHFGDLRRARARLLRDARYVGVITFRLLTTERVDIDPRVDRVATVATTAVRITRGELLRRQLNELAVGLVVLRLELLGG